MLDFLTSILVGSFTGLLFSQIIFFVNKMVDDSRQNVINVNLKLEEINSILTKKLYEINKKLEDNDREMGDRIKDIKNLEKELLLNNNITTIGSNGGIYKTLMGQNLRINENLINEMQNKINKEIKRLLVEVEKREETK